MPGKNDQGVVGEGHDDTPSSAAADQPGTIAGDSPVPTDVKGGEAGKGEGDTQSSPWEELLKKEEFVPKKDYKHAERKITRQGQENAAKDDEITGLTERIANLEGRLATQKTSASEEASEEAEDTFWEDDETKPNTKTGSNPKLQRVVEKQDLLESGMLELYDIYKRQNSVTESQKRLGFDTDVAERLQDLIDEGRTTDAMDLAGQAAIIKQEEVKSKQSDEIKKVEKVIEGGGTAGTTTSQESVSALKVEDLPKEKGKRDAFFFDRIKERFGIKQP